MKATILSRERKFKVNALREDYIYIYISHCVLRHNEIGTLNSARLHRFFTPAGFIDSRVYVCTRASCMRAKFKEEALQARLISKFSNYGVKR